jgi:hypothetical protein
MQKYSPKFSIVTDGLCFCDCPSALRKKDGVGWIRASKVKKSLRNSDHKPDAYYNSQVDFHGPLYVFVEIILLQ